jgi:DNA-binding XRE family transcriptional regulator
MERASAQAKRTEALPPIWLPWRWELNRRVPPCDPGPAQHGPVPSGTDGSVARELELKRLGARARDLRTAAGLTQQEVADAVGVTRATINRFEAGSNDFGSSRLSALAAALGASPRDFWT